MRSLSGAAAGRSRGRYSSIASHNLHDQQDGDFERASHRTDPNRYPIPMSVLICLTTCPDRSAADRIATALVDERLAACVNIVPGIHSTYRWQGQVMRDEELLLIIKTTVERMAELRARLPQLHPYELPELVAVESVDGLPAYLDWVRDETRPAL